MESKFFKYSSLKQLRGASPLPFWAVEPVEGVLAFLLVSGFDSVFLEVLFFASAMVSCQIYLNALTNNSSCLCQADLEPLQFNVIEHKSSPLSRKFGKSDRY